MPFASGELQNTYLLEVVLAILGVASLATCTALVLALAEDTTALLFIGNCMRGLAWSRLDTSKEEKRKPWSLSIRSYVVQL